MQFPSTFLFSLTKMLTVFSFASVLQILSTSWCSSATSSNANFRFSGLDRNVYARPGDVNIGALMILTLSTETKVCTDEMISDSWAVEFTEAMALAVDHVNKDPNLLGNLTLGFFILNDCYDKSISLAQSLAFLPRSGYSDNRMSWFYDEVDSNLEKQVPGYDVIGVLSPMRSTDAVPVSYVYSAAKVPLIGYTPTTDELSDKSNHPFYLRVISPDKFQASAMLSFIAKSGWSFISVVYSQGPYGEKAFSVIQSAAPLFNICIAVSHRVTDDDNTDVIADDLLNFPRARVVILFADEGPITNLLISVEKLNMTGHFIWLASDSIAFSNLDNLIKHRHLFAGTFVFTFYSRLVPELYEYIENQDVLNITNPWFKRLIEMMNTCSFNEGTCDENIHLKGKIKFDFIPFTSLLMDAVLAFAHGANDMIQDLCPEVVSGNLKNCLRKDKLFNYLSKVSFKGYNSRIEFDANGDIHGRYLVSQMAYGVIDPALDYGIQDEARVGMLTKSVAIFDTRTDELQHTGVIAWAHLREFRSSEKVDEMDSHTYTPDSVCSYPCGVGEFKSPSTMICCWECKRCRENEIIVLGNASCLECEMFSWPDTITGNTSCAPIPVSGQDVSSPLSIIQICFAALGIILTAVFTSILIYFRNNPVIVTTNKYLSFLKLTSILAGYVTVVILQTYPTQSTCAMLYFFLCLSFSSLYSALLVKAVTIYRLMRDMKAKRIPRFVSPLSQILLAVSLSFVQLGLCVAIYITSTPRAGILQPVLTQKFVELVCDVTLPGLSTFLTYNLTLLTATAVLTFVSRKHEDSLKQVKLISMCVSTSLVIWLAFIPTYFTAGREYMRVALMSLTVLLNHTVVLAFLFIPRLYAAFCSLGTRGLSNGNDAGASSARS